MNKLLTVIVPVYNVEAYLRKCVESILAQTYSNLELILIDDGSTDNCLAICHELEKTDNRIKVIHKENGGQGSARNRGLDVAKGDYIAFVDSDDYIEADMYKEMIASLESSDSDISLCGFITHSGLRVVNSPLPQEKLIYNSSEEILRAYFSSPYVDGSPCNKVFRKHIFDNIRYPEGVAREDVYIMHHLFAECNRAVHVGKCFYNYLIREGSTEHQGFNPKFLVSMKIADERCDFIRKNYPNLLPFAEKSCYGSRISAIKKIVRSHAVKENQQTYDELKAYLKANPAPTKEYEKLRILILYFPALYRLKLDFKNKYRAKIKKIVLKILKK